jgi:nucleotidyltransferase substrate binding protein (TIGR01987 family)
MSKDVRWKQRFQNFSKAFALLREPFTRKAGSLSDLEKEGIVQRFEITFELAWKTLKDYLVFNGVAFEQITPRNVIKEGFSSKVIADGQLWIDMLDRRNLLAHIYDESLLDETVSLIRAKFLPAFEQLFELLKGKST